MSSSFITNNIITSNRFDRATGLAPKNPGHSGREGQVGHDPAQEDQKDAQDQREEEDVGDDGDPRTGPIRRPVLETGQTAK